MHPLLIDWLHKIHLNADSALAAKRWKIADVFEKKTSRKEALQLLRAFLFAPAQPELIQSLTEQFLEIDKEFPGSDNAQDVRLEAGIVMIVAFSQRAMSADAFALGIRAATFPTDRCKPAQPKIVSEAIKYLEAQAELLRPSDFGAFDAREAIAEKLVAISAAEDDEKRLAAAQEFADILHNNYGEKIQRLSEETGLLWWLLGGFSNVLETKFEGIEDRAYALVSAQEVAKRTQMLPPPPSIYPIMGRALNCCKAVKPPYTIKEFVKAADATWRKKFVAEHPSADCAEFVPFVTALAKAEEADDAEVLTKVLPKICPGVAAGQKLSPLEAASQFYNELMFLKALAELE